MLTLDNRMILSQIGKEIDYKENARETQEKQKLHKLHQNYIKIPKMPWQSRRDEGMTERHAEIGHVSSGESFTSIPTRRQQHTRRRTINFSSVTTRRAHARSRVREREMERNGTGHH